jgi:serine/threonine protein kinase
MNFPEICPVCRKPLAPHAPRGLCPECLLKAGFPTGSQAAEEPRRPRIVFNPPEPAALTPLFPQLEILGLIGQGGMGAVYRARQTGLDRIVALKILPPQAAEDPGFAERFTREARALAQLNHPHIVAVHEFGKSGGYHFLLMEYVDGVNLRRLLESGRTDPRAALAIVPQICDALQFAHDRGIVHRDIKPENILLDKTGTVKIADFGLAKIVGSEANDLALTGARDVMGTPHYMAPEQVERPLAVDHRADIYSVGVVFYQMLTGELPIGRFAVPSKKVQVDVRLDEIVLRALEKEPELRFQQASTLRAEIETVATTPPGPAEKISPAASPSTTARPAPETLYGRWTLYWDNRTHFYGWLTFGAVAATIAVLMTRAPDRRQFAAAEDQYFVENQPGLAPRSPDQAVPLPANDRGNPSTMPLSQIVPEAPAPQTAPVPVAPAPVSGTGSLAAAEIANASFDLVEGNPEILLLMIRTANTALAEAKARFDAGLVSGQELQYLHLKLDLLQSRLAGNRIAFARVAHAAAEQRFTEAKTKYDFGVATQRTLDEVRSEMDISAIRLREAEARTAPVAEWGWTEPNATAFEPVVERTLGNIATGSAPELINFETGAVLYHRDILGTNLAGMTPEKTAEQFRTRGIDATGTLDSSTRGLAIWGGLAGPTPAAAWDTLPVDQLKQVFAGQKAGSFSVMAGTGPLPATYAFMTRTGRLGLLQIVGFSDQPSGVRIRYKLLKRENQP